MIRSSFAAKGLALGLLVLGSLACGDKPPPKPPETPPAADMDSGAGATSDTAGDAGAGGATGTSDTPPATPPAAAALALPAAAAKLTFKTKAANAVELKPDGSVTNNGKPVGKVTGMELQDPGGKTALKTDADGNVMGADGAPYAKFEGDDLVAQNGTKYNIGDDGALSSTDDKGKKTPMGKTEGVGAAKKTALLAAAFVMWGPKPPAAKADAKKPDAKKPAGKK